MPGATSTILNERASMASGIGQQLRDPSVHRDHSQPIELGKMPAELHGLVRETYRDAMKERHTQEEAFNEALRMLLRKASSAPISDPRRLLARMLTHEPRRLASDTTRTGG
jgi:hypothetical protein